MQPSTLELMSSHIEEVWGLSKIGQKLVISRQQLDMIGPLLALEAGITVKDDD